MNIAKLLKRLEWSSHQRGQGSGYMGSGGDGPLIRACPICGGIDPSDHHKTEFVDSSHGHRRKCELKKPSNNKKQMTDIHTTIIEALIIELRPHLPRCTLKLSKFLGIPTIHINGYGSGNGNICTLQPTNDGIKIIAAHDEELRHTTIEYCNPNLINLLVPIIESELTAFLNIKNATKKP